jgi:HSP20 family protein
LSATDPHAWMWLRAQEMLDETERVRRRFFGLKLRQSQPAWEPPADVFETDAALWIVLALPGVDPHSVEVQFEGSGVRVRAHRELPHALGGAHIVRMELPRGVFERELELPPGAYRLLEQAMEHGCLWLRLARLENT